MFSSWTQQTDVIFCHFQQTSETCHLIKIKLITNSYWIWRSYWLYDYFGAVKRGPRTETLESVYSVFPLHIPRDYTAATSNKGLIQRGPLSKVNTSDIKSLFWSEMKQNFNAAPSTSHFCGLLQDKLIKDQWQLYVYVVSLSRLQGTSANVRRLYRQ